MFLVVDTETTGLPYWNQSGNFKSQARIMQLAAFLMDEKFAEVASFVVLLKPTIDWPDVHPMAYEAHGLSKELCEAYGVPQAIGMGMLDAFMQRAAIRVAHNLKFDSFMIDVESERLDAPKFDWTRGICTMRASSALYRTKFPSKKGQGPNLAEMYNFAFDTEFDNAHDAMADCKAAACVFGYLVQNKHINLAEFKPTELVAEGGDES
jgi:DNA polymerase III epsilon subunit-like protein